MPVSPLAELGNTIAGYQTEDRTHLASYYHEEPWPRRTSRQQPATTHSNLAAIPTSQLWSSASTATASTYREHPSAATAAQNSPRPP